MTTITIAPATAALVFDEPTEYVDRTLATASWWDKYVIEPGTYAFEWVTMNHTPWNPDPNVHSAGFIANIGPYYGQVRVLAHLTESYRVSRLFSESRAHLEKPENPGTVRLSRTVYAFQLPGCPKGEHGPNLHSMLGGRVVRL